jgi:hypothetical protein
MGSIAMFILMGSTKLYRDAMSAEMNSSARVVTPRCYVWILEIFNTCNVAVDTPFMP